MSPGDVVQSALSPASPQADAIHHLWRSMLAVSTLVFLIVAVFVVVALVRGVRRRNGALSAAGEQRLARAVGAAVAATTVILLGLLVVSVWTSRAVSSLGASSGVTIAVTGHQWWWEIEYEDAIPARRVITANEIHLPIDRPVVLKVTSRDVIHSFWAPNLQGKRDLIPGYTTAIWMRADRAGRFRGQCAEFCGLQHAHMALDIVAESEADFTQWLADRRQPAREPPSGIEREGHDVFMSARCAGCHTVGGSEAHGQLGPDLTHIASRTTIGAGTLPNTREHLRAWVRDSQSSKPGNQMPPNVLTPEQMESLLAYLGTLR
jgi:cytochrome c oxidase subunit 2